MKSGEPFNLEGRYVMDIPSSDGPGDASNDTLAFGPLTESEYERLTCNVGGPCEKGDGWRSCAICLEEMDTDLRRHASCSCVLCESCIDVSLLKLQLKLLSSYIMKHSLVSLQWSGRNAEWSSHYLSQDDIPAFMDEHFLENLVARQIFWFPEELASTQPTRFSSFWLNVILNTCRSG
jgi:hypothetical protein